MSTEREELEREIEILEIKKELKDLKNLLFEIEGFQDELTEMQIRLETKERIISEGFKILAVCLESIQKELKYEEYKINEVITFREWKELKKVLEFYYSKDEIKNISYKSRFKELEDLYSKKQVSDLKVYIDIGIKNIKEM